jgi:hypothetical protein
MKEDCLLTSSSDGYIKIWDLNTGELRGNMNLNYPLPIKWTIDPNN